MIAKLFLPVLLLAFLASLIPTACNQPVPEQANKSLHPNIPLILPAGFSAEVVADSLGHLRHLVLNREGDIYVTLSTLRNGKGIYMLSDTDGNKTMDIQTGFASYPGTGIAISNGYLYTASNTGVYRFRLNAKGQVQDTAHPELIVTGLIDSGRDNSKSIALDSNHHLFVTVGAYNETCREKGSGTGIPGCPLRNWVGGIWEFSADHPGQRYAGSIHYAYGIKNAVGIAWNKETNSLFAMQHGRGAFDDKFPQYYTPQQSQALPAETMYELHQGSDAGWPFVYYDPFRKKLILSPEYGGDGKKQSPVGYQEPIAAFPAHLAPDDLIFYTGSQFPQRYRNGAFIAFHNQNSILKEGFLVAFVPFKDGKPSGNWEIFANNFAGTDLAKPSGPIRYRPTGLAQGPDGSLYVADDLQGTIFRISYTGQKTN